MAYRLLFRSKNQIKSFAGRRLEQKVSMSREMSQSLKRLALHVFCPQGRGRKRNNETKKQWKQRSGEMKRIRRVNEGNEAVNVIAVHNMHTWKCHDEIHYFLQVLCINKKAKRINKGPLMEGQGWQRRSGKSCSMSSHVLTNNSHVFSCELPRMLPTFSNSQFALHNQESLTFFLMKSHDFIA